jgi:hypothetical protein
MLMRVLLLLTSAFLLMEAGPMLLAQMERERADS